MRIFIASEFRCHVFQGIYYLDRKAYLIYKRYAEAFGDVVLCSRFVKIDKLESDMFRADFIVDVVSVDSLTSALLGKYNASIRDHMKSCDIVICRLPSVIAYKAAEAAKSLHKPILAELMCDGWDPYWNHGFSGKMIAPYMHRKMKQVTYDADYAVYVTEKFLQQRYPCKNQSIHASNVQISDVSQEILNRRLEKIAASKGSKELSLMTTASIDLRSKGQRFVVRAMGQLKKQGIQAKYYLVGDGSQEHLRAEAKKCGVEDQLVFLGRLPLEEVFAQIDKVDIYIQPSLQEGLPRAVIEAMSRACPCLGARTAGIPELLDEECVFERASADSITQAIARMLDSDLSAYAKRNFNHSKDYLEAALNERRNMYFQKIYDEIKGKR